MRRSSLPASTSSASTASCAPASSRPPPPRPIPAMVSPSWAQSSPVLMWRSMARLRRLRGRRCPDPAHRHSPGGPARPLLPTIRGPRPVLPQPPPPLPPRFPLHSAHLPFSYPYPFPGVFLLRTEQVREELQLPIRARGQHKASRALAKTRAVFAKRKRKRPAQSDPAQPASSDEK